MQALVRLLFSYFVTYFVVKRAYRRKSLDSSGCIAAFLVGIFVTWSNLCHFAALSAFFYTSNKATHFKEDVKALYDEHFKQGGQRNAIQVFCNGFFAFTFSLLYILECGVGERAIDFHRDYKASVYTIAFLSSLSCSCGDTLASEIGTVFQESRFNFTFHITSFKRVPRGTNGGISLVGTLASFLGGLAVGLGYYIVLSVILLLGDSSDKAIPPQWPILIISSMSGLLGSIIDSILGGTLQYSGWDEDKKIVVEVPSKTSTHISGIQVFSNSQVNFFSILITIIIAPYVGCRVYKNL